MDANAQANTSKFFRCFMDDLLCFMFGYVTRIPSRYGDSAGCAASFRIYALLAQNVFMGSSD
jgi:hypothetical protein